MSHNSQEVLSSFPVVIFAKAQLARERSEVPQQQLVEEQSEVQ
jgi:hypothetical protein